MPTTPYTNYWRARVSHPRIQYFDARQRVDCCAVEGRLRWSAGLLRRRSLAVVWGNQLGLAQRLWRLDRTTSLRSSVSVRRMDQRENQREL